MGEIADEHQSFIMDELEAMERMGSTELYERYSLTGEEIRIRFGHQHNSATKKYTCNFCGEGGFIWGGPRNARRLFKHGQPHYCLKRNQS